MSATARDAGKLVRPGAGLAQVGVSALAASVPVPGNFNSGYTYTDHLVPVGAGWTDGSDARANIQSFLNAIPSGASATSHRRIVFRSGFRWVIGGNLSLAGKSHWTIEGQGTETTYGNTGGGIVERVGGPGPGTEAGEMFSASYFSGSGNAFTCSDIRFHCLVLVGNSPLGRYATAVPDTPTKNHGVSFRSCDGGRVSHCVFRYQRGDAVYVSASAGGGTARSRNIRIDGNLIENNERMGVALINCSDVTIEDNRFRHIFYAAIDLEPNRSDEGIHNTTIRNNLFSDIWSWGTSYNDGCIKADSPQSPDTTGFVLIEGNVVTGAPQGGSGPFIDMRYSAPGYQYIKTAALTIRNNTCTNPRNGPVARLRDWVDGATITNNTGFRSGGAAWLSNEGNNGTIVNSGNT